MESFRFLFSFRQKRRISLSPWTFPLPCLKACYRYLGSRELLLSSCGFCDSHVCIFYPGAPGVTYVKLEWSNQLEKFGPCEVTSLQFKETLLFRIIHNALLDIIAVALLMTRSNLSERLRYSFSGSAWKPSSSSVTIRLHSSIAATESAMRLTPTRVAPRDANRRTDESETPLTPVTCTISPKALSAAPRRSKSLRKSCVLQEKVNRVFHASTFLAPLQNIIPFTQAFPRYALHHV